MIYFLRAGDHVKIGWSNDNKSLKRRVQTLQTGQPNKIDIIRKLGAERWAETWLHGFFSGVRMAGEWFEFDQEMLTVEPPEINPKVKKRLAKSVIPVLHHARLSSGITEDDVRDRLREACQEAGGKAAWAARHGVQRSIVSDVLNGHRAPAAAVLKPLGLERVLDYREIAIKAGASRSA